MSNPTDPLPRRRRGVLRVEHGQPLRFTEEAQRGEDVGDEVDVDTTALILTFRAYRKAAKELLNGRYAPVQQLAPAHLREPCNVTILKCADGVLVRHDVPDAGEPKVRAATVRMTLQEAAPAFSEGLLHFPDDPSHYVPAVDGPTMVMSKFDATGVSETVAAFRPVILGSTKLPPGVHVAPPPARPLCIASLTNEFDIVLGGVIMPSDNLPSKDLPGDRFVARSRVSLPSAWRAIEVYLTLGEGHWKPDFAPLWAELDIQAAVVQRNVRNAEFQAIDSRGATRQKCAALLAEFESLFEGAEEPLHQFLKSHPELLSPTHEKYWSKLRFGDHVSDFVFREPTNDYELVEIEAPLRALFRKDGHPRQELNHAIGQTRDWTQYISANRERVERELGLDGISTNPRTLVVIGRAADVTPEHREKLVTIQAVTPKLRILTYDDVLSLARTNLERILGPLGFTGYNVEFHYY